MNQTSEHKPAVTLSEFQQLSEALAPVVRTVIRDEMREPLDSLNKRVTALERWRWYVAGGLAVAVSVLYLVVK